MKNPLELLRSKEAELERLQEEVDALRLVGQLLEENSNHQPKPHNPAKVLHMRAPSASKPS